MISEREETDWLDTLPVGSDTPVLLASVAKGSEVRPLCRDAWLAIHRKGEHVMKFALLVFESSDVGGENVMVSAPVRGYGVLGLRELRHTWWGDGDGYWHYPDLEAVGAMWGELKEFFGDD